MNHWPFLFSGFVGEGFFPFGVATPTYTKHWSLLPRRHPRGGESGESSPPVDAMWGWINLDLRFFRATPKGDKGGLWGGAKSIVVSEPFWGVSKSPLKKPLGFSNLDPRDPNGTLGIVRFWSCLKNYGREKRSSKMEFSRPWRKFSPYGLGVP